MGIKQFSTYLGLNPKKNGWILDAGKKRFFKRYELQPGTILIVDGAGISITLCGKSDDDPKFGNDYDVLYEKLHQFFLDLKRCNITPIVLMDGYYMEQKQETMQSREDDSLQCLKNYKQSKGLQSNRSVPIFKTKIFLDVLDNLEIFYYRCDSEADDEIIQLAKKLNCPVLSFDSDFALCKDVKFIPYQLGLNLTTGGKSFECFEFNKKGFSDSHGIPLSKLPLLAVIFKSDHWNYDFFDIRWPKKTNCYLAVKIKTASEWLRDKSDEEAKEYIISFVAKEYRKDKRDVEKDYDITMRTYNGGYIHTHLLESLKNDKNIKDKLPQIEFNKKESDLEKKDQVPEELLDLVRKCKIPNITLDMFTFHSYLCRPQAVEDIDLDSIYKPSFHLIQGIYGLIARNYSSTILPSLKIKIRSKDKMIDEFIDHLSFPREKLSEEQKYEILKEISCCENLEELKYFDDDWYIFILALIYIKSDRGVPDLNKNYIHAMMLTAFVLQIVTVYKRNDNFNLETEEDDISENKKFIPSSYLKNLSKKTIEKIAKEAQLMRCPKKKDREWNGNEICHIHIYLTFQATLYHMIQVFTLLNLSDKIGIQNFICGRFFYSIFNDLESSSFNYKDFIYNFSDNSPDFIEAYEEMVNKLQFYFSNSL